MTLAEIRSHTLEILEPGNFAYLGPVADIVTADINVVINRALEMCGRRLFVYSNSIAGTITDDKRVYRFDTDFARRLLTVDRVELNGATLRDFNDRYGLCNLGDFDARLPAWRTTTKGVPTYATENGESLIFSRPTNSSTVTSMKVSGRHLPLALANDAHVPEINSDLHHYIAMLTAVLLSYPTASTDESWQRVSNYSTLVGQEFEAEYTRQYRSVYGVDPPNAK